jgi:hypothetical protein
MALQILFIYLILCRGLFKGEVKVQWCLKGCERNLKLYSARITLLKLSDGNCMLIVSSGFYNFILNSVTVGAGLGQSA